MSRIIFSMIGAGAVLIGSASDASAFEFLGRALGGGCCGYEPSCGFAAEPSCGIGYDACCDAGCGRHHGLFHRWRHRGGCCDIGPSCGCAAEPSCGFAVEPSCGCAAAPSCGCGRRHHRGLFGGLFHRNRCCDAGPSCGCAAEPACGCAVEPACGCAG